MIRKIRRNAEIFYCNNKWNLSIIVLIFLIALASTLLSAASNPDYADRIWWSGFWQNFGTEMIGAIMTFALFGVKVAKLR